jgi:xanthine dehydrogenase accessory factor
LSISNLKVLIRGGGELASAVACRLAECHFRIVMTETPNPEAVRRHVAFCEAVYEGDKTVEGKKARLVKAPDGVFDCWARNELALLVDPAGSIRESVKPDVEIDAIIAKRNTGTRIKDAPLVIGLGIGFEAGKDVHVVIETNRGHNLGRVLRSGIAEADTGHPGIIAGYGKERVFRAPQDGVFRTVKNIGDMVQVGDTVAYVGEEPVKVVIPGIIRGLLRDGTPVVRGMKAGDVDPRGIAEYCETVSDKGRAIAGGVLEAILAFYNQA